MVEITATYEGDLRVAATHGPSGGTLNTDAPVDNHGKGESFSPTDLVATALGTCILTILGIQANKHGFALGECRVRVEKHMATEGKRRISRLPAELHIAGVPENKRESVLAALHACPVHGSLHPDIDTPIDVTWTS